MAAGRLWALSAPVGRSGREAATRLAVPGGAPTASARASSAPATSSLPGGEHVHLAPVGDQIAGHARVGEERHGGEGVGEDQVLGPLELGHA